MTLTIRPYERRYREKLLNLIFYSRRTHTHLDWYRPGPWLDRDDILVRVAWDEDELLGVMGLSAPLNGASWVRLATISNTADTQAVMKALWRSLCDELRAWEIQSVAILIINRWLSSYVPELGFKPLEEVITLFRTGTELPPLTVEGVEVRSGYIEDLPDIVRIDHSAFAPPWQMTADELRQSQRQAASCTIALLDNTIIGYQISTRHHTSGHLARLGVDPAIQGRGVGKVLLDNLIQRFNWRGVRTLTVNTQLSNYRSQRLYERYGFARNGFDLPVWSYSAPIG